jgi:hypothetical protein
MLAECNCFTRQCKYYVGIIQPDGTEMSETNFCGAFPKGIPDEIAYGDNDHSEVLPDQAKPYVYEKSDDWGNNFDVLPKDDVELWMKINKEGYEKSMQRRKKR